LRNDNEKFMNSFYNNSNVSYYQDFSVTKNPNSKKESLKRHLGDPLIDKKKLFAKKMQAKPALGGRKRLHDNEFYSNGFLKDHTINLNRFKKYDRFK